MIIFWQIIKRARVQHVAYVAVIALAFYSWNQTQENKTLRVALANPKTVEVVKTVTVTGPVRVVTRVIEKPTGERETTTTEDRGEVTEVINSDTKKEPVDLNKIRNHNRWLAGVSNRDFSFRDVESYGAWGGYSWNNRADLLAGWTRHEHSEANLLFVWRF